MNLFFALLSLAHAGSYSGGSFVALGDDSRKEIFGESVNAHAACAGSNLYNTTAEVNAFISRMAGPGYTNYRHYTDYDAWSSDFDQSLYDLTRADAGDFWYVSTHGGSGGFYFCGSSGDDLLGYWESNWGDGDAEIGILSSCYSLDSGGRSAFATANLNDGVHHLLGFESTALDLSTIGDLYGYYLANGYYIDNGWMFAVDGAHPVGHTSADLRFQTTACATYWERLSSLTCDPKSGSTAVSQTWVTTG